MQRVFLPLLIVLAVCLSQFVGSPPAAADDVQAQIGALDAKIQALEKYLAQLKAERNSRKGEGDGEQEGESENYFDDGFGEGGCYEGNEEGAYNDEYELFFGDRDLAENYGQD